MLLKLSHENITVANENGWKLSKDEIEKLIEETVDKAEKEFRS